MLNFEKGTFFNRDGSLKQSLSINYRKLSEFRLTPSLDFLPKDKDGNVTGPQKFGYYSIDGEKYDTTEIQGKVLHKFLSVMCL